MELRAVLPQDGRETQLLTWITYEPVHIDEIQRASGLPVAAVSSSLTMMEIRGLVKQVGGMNYVRTREAPALYETANA